MITYFTGALLLIFSAGIYWSFFALNSVLFTGFNFSTGVSWIFLPAGLRLLLTLLFAEEGAIGISIASFYIALTGDFKSDLITAIVTSIISGGAPLLARALVISKSGITANLSNLNNTRLLICVLFFSMMSPIMHQIWFYLHNYTDNFFTSLTVMIIGDFMGTMIIIYLAKLIIFTWRLKNSNASNS